MRVCKSGRISTGCGEVTRLGYQYTDSSGYTYSDLAATTYRRDGTDSGGPVYANNTAYGLHQGGSSTRAFYQGIRGAMNALNVDVQIER